MYQTVGKFDDYVKFKEDQGDQGFTRNIATFSCEIYVTYKTTDERDKKFIRFLAKKSLKEKVRSIIEK